MVLGNSGLGYHWGYMGFYWGDFKFKGLGVWV